MTGLTYLFPAVSGCLKFSLLSKGDAILIVDRIWLAYYVSLASICLCLLYIVIIESMHFSKYRKLQPVPILRIIRQFRSDFQLLLSLSNGVFATVDLMMFCLVLQRSRSATVTLITYSQAQLVFSLIVDIFGLFKAPIRYPTSLTLVGTNLVVIGSVLLEVYPILNFGSFQALSGVDSLTSTRFLLVALPALPGMASVIYHVYSRQQSIVIRSYWAGTAIATIEMGIILTVVALSTFIFSNPSPNLNSFKSNQILYILLGSLGVIMSAACMQYFGDRGGFHCAFAPVIAGQMMLSTAFSMFQAEDDQIPVTFYTLLGLLLVFFGTIIMWYGRRWQTYTHNPNSELRSQSFGTHRVATSSSSRPFPSVDPANQKESMAFTIQLEPSRKDRFWKTISQLPEAPPMINY